MQDNVANNMDPKKPIIVIQYKNNSLFNSILLRVLSKYINSITEQNKQVTEKIRI